MSPTHAPTRRPLGRAFAIGLLSLAIGAGACVTATHSPAAPAPSPAKITVHPQGATDSPSPSPPPPGGGGSSTPSGFDLTPASGFLDDESRIATVSHISSDGTKVLYQASVDGDSDYSLLLRDRTAATTTIVDHAFGDPKTATDLSASDWELSADGTTVVFVSHATNLLETFPGNGDHAYVTDTNGGNVRMIPQGEDDTRDIAISADGSRAALVLEPGAGANEKDARIVVVNLKTMATVRTVVLPSFVGKGLRLSGDGSTIAVVTGDDDSTFVRVLDATTGATVHDLRDFDGGEPAIDATGRHVAYPSTDDCFVVWDRQHPDDQGDQVPYDQGTTPLSGSLSADGRTFALGSAQPAGDDGGFFSSVASIAYLDSSTGDVIAGRASTGFGDAGDPATAPEISTGGDAIALWHNGRIEVATPKTASGDVTDPTWPSGATLQLQPLDRSTVRMTWPTATDDTAVSGYEVDVNNSLTVVAAPNKHTWDASLPAPSATFPVSVTPIDSSGNRGAPLTGNARGMQALDVQTGDFDKLHLTYSAPQDRAGITALRIMRADAGPTMNDPAVDPSTFVTLDDMPLNTQSYFDTPPKLLHNYGYRIDAVHADGSTSVLTETSIGTTDAPPSGALTISAIRSSQATLAWPAAPINLPVKDFVIKRKSKDEPDFSAVATVAATKSTYVDDAVQAGTTYTWQVVAEYGDGWFDRDYTGPARASTLLPGIAALTLDAPLTSNGDAYELGGSFVVHAEDEPGLTGTAKLFATSDATSPVATLALHETSDGKYETTPIVLDGTDFTAIDHVTVSLTDGNRTDTDSRDGRPLSGRADITIAPSDEMLPGLHLTFDGPGPTTTIDASAGSTAHDFLAPGDYDVELVTSDHDVVAKQDGVTIHSGAVVTLALTPVRHAELHLELQAPAGQDVQPGTVTITNDKGAVVDTEHVASGAYIYGLPSHAHLHLAFTLDDHNAKVTVSDLDVTTGVGEQDVTMTQVALAQADATVTITGGGQPVADATLTMTQTVDGRTFTATARTDEHGQATLHGVAGAASITAAAQFYVTSGTSTTLAVSAPRSVTLDLLRSPTYRIRPHLITQDLGGSAVEQALDWRTAGHFYSTLVVGGASQPIAPAVAYDGSAGDTATFCADGHDAGLDKKCSTVTLGTDKDVDVTVTLTQAATAKAHLVIDTGAAVTHWWVDIYRELGTGGSDWVGRQMGTGSDVTLGFAAAGEYTAHWSDGDGDRGSSHVVVTDGSPASIGTVTLSAQQPAPDAVDAQALPPTVVPGDIVTYRIGLPHSAISRSGVRLSLPTGANATAGTATVDGQPVASTVLAGKINVPLATGTAATVVRIPVVTDAGAADGDLAANVQLVLAGGGIQDIAAIHASIRRLSIAGATTVATPSFPVSGTAPAGTKVTVRDGNGAAIGSATAGAGGRWNAVVTLKDALAGSTYTLVATAPTGGADAMSDPLEVTYDDDDVVATSITLDNSTPDAPNRKVTYDPRNGSAAFTMVFVPDTPITVTATFGANTARITNFVAYVGDLQAAGSCGATTCSALVPAGEASEVGDIALGYDVAGRPVASLFDGTAPTVDQLVHTTASPFNEPKDLDFDVDDLDNQSGKWTVDGTQLSSTLSIGPSVPHPAVTATDQAVSTSAGLAIRDLKVSAGKSADGYSIQWSAYVDSSVLNRASGSIQAAARPHGVADAFKEVKGLYSIYSNVGTFKDLMELLTTGAKTPELDALDRWVDDNVTGCNPDVGQDLHARIQDSREIQFVDALGKNGFSWLSMAEGSFAEAGGLAKSKLAGLFDFEMGWFIGKGIDQLDKIAIDRAAAAVKDVTGGKQCDPRVKFRPRDYKYPAPKPGGSPTWIFDPSGYAYSGPTANRLAGVSATIYSAPSKNGPWTVWNAADFGQTNPQVTAGDGQYGWDVAVGWWQVRYSKPGYASTASAPMQVLPERFDVNVDLHPTARPALTAASASGRTVSVAFDRYMTVATTTAALALHDRHGRTVPTTVRAIGAATTATGAPVARRFTLTAGSRLLPGSTLTVMLAPSATDYHGTHAVSGTRSATVAGQASPAQLVLDGFDWLVYSRHVSIKAIKPARTHLVAAARDAAARHQAAARSELAKYRKAVADRKHRHEITVAQARALTAYAATAARGLGL